MRAFRGWVPCACLLVFAWVSLGSSAAHGSAKWDTTFGANGYAVETSGVVAVPEGFALDGSGRPLITGGSRDESCSHLGVVRFTSEGKPDSSFGIGGSVQEPRRCETGTSILPLARGESLAFGYQPCFARHPLVCLMTSYKLSKDGSPASGWGFSAVDGRRDVYNTENGGTTSLTPSSAVLDANRRVLVVGKANYGPFRSGGFVLRFRRDGALDQGLRGSRKGGPIMKGRLVMMSPAMSSGTLSQVRSLKGGKILVAGWHDGDLIAMRLNYNGQPDPGFGVGGKVTLDLDGMSYCPCTRVYSMAQDRRGRIVLGGSAGPHYQDGRGDGYHSFLVRLRPDGTRDSSFGKRGLVVPSLGSSSVESLVVQKNGRIVASGSDGHDSFIARFKQDGSRDSGFFDDGVLHLARMQQATHMQADSKGRILVAGMNLNVGGVKVRRLLPD